MAVTLGGAQNNFLQPELFFVLDHLGSPVKDAVFLPGDGALVTGTADRSLRVWMKRDSSKFWPSAVEILPSPATCIIYCQSTRTVFAGLENGTVSEFILADDLNHLKHKKDYLSHFGCVTGLAYDSSHKWIFSVSKDKRVSWYSNETGKCLDVRLLDHPATCLFYDSHSGRLFVGDANGRITILTVATTDANQARISEVRQVCAHQQSVTSLSWDRVNHRLFSSSVDNSVAMWDLMGSNVVAYDLQGHTKQATSIYWWAAGNARNIINSPNFTEKCKGLAISGGLDGRVIFWFMDPRRVEAVSWSGSNACQICGAPFFWNFKKMWSDMTPGLRQHHCRKCGKAVCYKCSPVRTTIPALGFERDVRVCNVCAPTIKPDDRQSLAIEFDARHPVVHVRLEEDLRLLLTVGEDNTVKIWDIKSFV